jgi:hypothetical protein
MLRVQSLEKCSSQCWYLELLERIFVLWYYNIHPKGTILHTQKEPYSVFGTLLVFFVSSVSIQDTNTLDSVGFEVLRAVVMKNTVCCDITACSPLKVNRRFGGTSPPSLGQKKSWARNRSVCHLLLRWFLYRLILRPWSCRWHVPPKHRLTFNGLHGVVSQIIVLFTVDSNFRKMNNT